MPQLQTYGKIARWLLRNSMFYRLQMVLNVLLGVAYVGSSLAFVWATKWTIDIATGAVRAGRAGAVAEYLGKDQQLDTAIGLLIGIIVLQVVLGFASRWIQAVLGIKARNTMQERLFSRLLSCDWIAVRKYHTGDVLNRVMQDVNVVVKLLTEEAPQFITTLVQLAGAFAFMYLMDRRLAVIVLCIAPAFILFSKLYFRKLRSLTHEVRSLESEVQSCIQESLQHSLVVKTLEKVDYVTSRLMNCHIRLRRKIVEKTWYGSVSQLVMNAGFATGYLVTFVWGVKNLEAGVITYGALTAFVQLVGQIQAPIRTLSQFIPVFVSAFTSSERLMELEAIPLETTTVEGTAAETELHGPLRFENVTFQYDVHLRKVLDGFCYEFPVGSSTAIVGETGAGKTTMIRLMLALIAPTEGRVLFGERSVSAADRRAFTYVPQGNTLLSGTIRDNLLLGNPSATVDELLEVLRVACADFVGQLPNGLSTVCEEMGGGLSEGQAQRICIARALLRKSPILLFDESTSALDEQTEKAVVNNIRDFAADKTLIFVTHRPAILEICSQVLRLENHR